MVKVAVLVSGGGTNLQALIDELNLGTINGEIKLVISNRKNAEYINEIGETLEKKYPSVKYLHADFKKGDGINKNEALNKELHLYHQNYCGCEFSIRDCPKTNLWLDSLLLFVDFFINFVR